MDSPLSGDQITEVIDAVSLDSVVTLTDWYPWLGRDLEGAPIILSSKSVEEPPPIRRDRPGALRGRGDLVGRG